MKKLILVNGIFALGLVAFIALPVTSNWLWLGFIFTWCWMEGVLAQNPEIKWWHMVLVFLGLGTLDVIILYFLNVL